MTASHDRTPDEELSRRGVLWWSLFPFRIPIELAVILFDLTLSRHLMAAVAVGIIWVPLHFAADLSFNYWLWPTVIIGCCLTGLWEGCDIFTIRPYLSRWLLFPHKDK